jgi:ABC-type nitrate/sulfonate/bicarbonate transport system permease component
MNQRKPGALRWQAWAASTLVFALLLSAWWAASTSGWVSRVFLPTPGATLDALRSGLGNGELLAFSAATTTRMLQGWLLASLLGIALGAAVGVSTQLRTYLQPTLEFLRPLPASALLPLAIAIFGLSANMVLAVVAFGAMWPVLLATVHGLASVDSRLKEVAACLEMSRPAVIFKIGLPNAMPDILAGMRLSMTVSLIVAVVGEMIASQSGLGQAILLAARSYHASELFAGIVLLGLIGFISNGLLALAEKKLLRWQTP